jgi:hypothetical protein
MAEFWFLYKGTLRQMGKPSLWAPLLVQALLAVILAMIHYYIFSPVAGPLVSAWVHLIKPSLGAGYFHYPAQFVIFPYLFGLARLVLNALTEAFFMAVVVDLFYAIYRGERPILLVSFKKAWSKYLPMMLVWLVLLAILFAVSTYFNDFVMNVLGFNLHGAPRRQMAASFALRVLTMIIYVPFMYMIPAIMAGQKTGESVRRALMISLRHPFITFGLIVIPYLLGFLPAWAAGESQKIVSNFYPELVYYLTLLSIVVDAVVNFLVVGTSAKFYLDHS